MSTPPNDEPPAAADQPTESQPPTPPPPPAPPPHAMPPVPPGGMPDQQYAFAAIPRAPRVPWINPARRGHVTATAIGAALVVLLAGIGIGWAVTPTHHRYRFVPAFRFMPGGYFPGELRNPYGYPRFPKYPPTYPTPTSVPTAPAPSST